MTTTNGWLEVRNGMPEKGANAQRDKEMAQSDIELFSAMTGDRNPLHTDVDAATGSKFGGVIVQGGVTTGILNAIVAQDLPGPGTVFLSANWRFEKPVYVGDRITGHVEVIEVRDDKPICTIETVIRNQRNEVCLTGTAITYTSPLPV
jgi:acyl dehydratase